MASAYRFILTPLCRWLLGLLLALACYPGNAWAAQSEYLEADHVRVQWLLPESLVPGQVNRAGIHFSIDPEWHVYWLNPGDSGAAPRFDFAIQGADIGPVLWPFPRRMPIAHLTNFGYEDEVVYLFDLTPKEGAAAVELTVDLEWLVCKEDCIPGFGVLSASRPVGDRSEWQPEALALLERFSAKLPRPARGSPWQISSAQLSDDHRLTLALTGSGPAPELFPKDGNLISPAAPESTPTADGVRLTFAVRPATAVPETLGFVLVDDARAWSFPELPVETRAVGVDTSESSGIWLLIVFAFLGGLILNLMPCVFPVLSIKLFSLIKMPGQGEAQLARRVREGLLYTAGVLVTFALLGALLLLLRAGGAAIGWGFQLQSAPIVLALIILFWVMALSFVGAFEFGHALVRLGGRGSGGSFSTGVLAVFVAAPCTGPFMGVALGAAATLPALPAMAIFLGLGAGLAAPFLLLAAVPALTNRLPAPGPWMETLRQFLAFPLFATVLWLVWVLGRISGEDGWLLAGAVLLCLSFAAWLARSPRRLWHWVALLVAAVTLVASFAQLNRLEAPAEAAASPASLWHPYDAQAVADAREEGRPVFIDYTAAWCVTCQVNKSLVLDTEAAEALFQRHQVYLVRADWTRHDPEITASLAALGRNSVPTYAFYPPGGDVQLLPQVLNMRLLRRLFEP